MPQFFINENEIIGSRAFIRGDDFHHLVHVRRVKAGDQVDVRTSSGDAYTASVTAIENDSIEIILSEKRVSEEETVDITLYLSLIKGANFELAIQKAAEAGVNRIVPVVTSRSVPHLTEKVDDRLVRWNKIVSGAAKQCMRVSIPPVVKPVPFSSAVEDLNTVKLIAHTSNSVNIREYLSSLTRPDSVSILVGPEGGFSESEVTLAGSRGWVAVRFGATCLRAETAAVVIPSLVIYQWS